MQLGLGGRVSALVAGVAGVTALVVVGGMLTAFEDSVESGVTRELTAHGRALDSAIADDAFRAETLAAQVAAIPAVQRALAERDRPALAALYEAGFAGLRAPYALDQFQFHIAPAVSFYRVHQPARFGDDLAAFRFTVVAANRDGKPVRGLEGGVAGIGIRGVVPVMAGGAQVGSVEYGTSFGQGFFDRFKANTGVDVAIRLIGADRIATFAATAKDFTPFDDQALRRIAAADRLEFLETERAGQSVRVLAQPVKDYRGAVLGVAEITLDTTSYGHQIRAVQQRALGIGLAAVLAAALIGWLIARPACRLLVSVADLVTRIGAGETTGSLPRSGRVAELADIAESVEVFRDRSEELRALQAAQQAKDASAAVERALEFAALADGFQETVGQLVDDLGGRVDRLRQELGIAHEAAVRSRAGAGAASEDVRGAGDAVNAVAAATEELAASIKEIAAQVASAAGVTSTAVVRVEEATAAIGALNAAAEKIDDVARLISAIAGQTNLLALNATIEAARAGEAGRGFAVVAAEVKNLSMQTAQATGDIASQIASVQSASRAVTASVEGVGQAIRQVDGIASAMAAATEQQQAATSEIARSLQEAAAGTQRSVDEMGNLERDADTGGQLVGSAVTAVSAMADATRQLSDEAERFAAGVRARVA